MAHIVCQVIGRPDRVSFTWSEGAGAFDPYEMTGQTLLNFRTWRSTPPAQRLSALVKDYLNGADDDVRRSALELAQAGAKLCSPAVPARCRPGGAHGQGRRAPGSRRCAPRTPSRAWRSSSTACGRVPWNVVYDREPDRAGVPRPGGRPRPLGAVLGPALQPRGQPPGRAPAAAALMRDPKVLLVIDPVDPPRPARGPAGAARRAGRVATACRWSAAASELAEALAEGRPDLLYWLCHADPDGPDPGRRADQPERPARICSASDGDEPARRPGLPQRLPDRRGGPTRVASSTRSTRWASAASSPPSSRRSTPSPTRFGLDFLEAFLDSGEPIGPLLQTAAAPACRWACSTATYCPPGIRVARPRRRRRRRGRVGDLEGPRLAGLALGAASTAAATARPRSRRSPRCRTSPTASLASYDREDRGPLRRPRRRRAAVRPAAGRPRARGC